MHSLPTNRPVDVEREVRALDGLPADQREYALDILAIKHGLAIVAALRNQRIDASANVVRLDAARGKPYREK